MGFEKVGETLVFRAGRGEWYNQPHDKRWDMGEEAADIPAANWHVELENSLESNTDTARRLLIDSTDMVFLADQDLGFLLRISKKLSASGMSVALVARKNMVEAIRIAKLDKYFSPYVSMNDALSDSANAR